MFKAKIFFFFSLRLKYAVSYETYDSYYLPLNQKKSCTGSNECGSHYWCTPEGHTTCLNGWEGQDCNTPIPLGWADCSVYAGTLKLYKHF